MWKYNDSNYTNELYHYGVKGMKLGVRRAKRSTDSKGLSKAADRYKKKEEKGSLHNFKGLALEDMGYKKAANRSYKKADYKESKWRAKSNRAKGIKKVYDQYIKDIDALKKKGSNGKAFTQRTKLYWNSVKDVKNDYRKEIERARKSIYG